MQGIWLIAPKRKSRFFSPIASTSFSSWHTTVAAFRLSQVWIMATNLKL